MVRKNRTGFFGNLSVVLRRAPPPWAAVFVRRIRRRTFGCQALGGAIVGRRTAQRQESALANYGQGGRAPRTAARATFALNEGLWILRVRLDMDSPRVDWVGTRSQHYTLNSAEICPINPNHLCQRRGKRASTFANFLATDSGICV